MFSKTKETTLVFIIILINSLFLIYGINTLSISYYEADIFFNENSVVAYLVRASCMFFGQNDYALRLPFVLIHVISVILIYKIGKPYLKRKIDRVVSVLIYTLLPGTISAALLVNAAGLVICFTLLFVYLYQEEKKIASYVILFITLFIDQSFIILYFVLFFFALYKKDNFLIIFSLTLFSAGAFIYNMDIQGKPRGYFLDTFAVYSAIFSPLVFLYFIYVLYRILIKKEKNIIWWISFGAFVCSILLSFRQKIPIEDFAPFAVIATPLLVRSFFNSYRVRLPQHRRIHNIWIVFVLLSLLGSSFLAIFNHTMYSLYKNPKKHFAYPYHIAKELSIALYEQEIEAIHVDDKRLALRLKFYGIGDSDKLKLRESTDGDIKIKYINTYIASYKILKI